ncbi:MAG: hypothetical protein EBE86_009970 [Hormoscilla sp. GUM202]|nr:hypothetical protein [Hormoscilla sp. GUM202]
MLLTKAKTHKKRAHASSACSRATPRTEQYCHDYKSARDGSKGRIHDRNDEAEEPDEVKVSRPVLKTSREGDFLA